MTEYPEPPGYVNKPGFVKSNQLNNDSYVESLKGDPWYPFIWNAHQRLKELDPNYNIAQIKAKFGGLRFYWDSNLEYGDPIRTAMDRVVARAEALVEGYERRLLEEAGKLTQGELAPWQEEED